MLKDKRNWEPAGKWYVDLWSPLDAQVVKLCPTAEEALTSDPPHSPLEALQVTAAGADGTIHTVTLKTIHALKLAQVMLHRLSEYGDPAAREIVDLIERYHRPNPPLEDREAA